MKTWNSHIYRIFETLLPRESASKEVDMALLLSISFPAFATHDPDLYVKTKSNIIGQLGGNWGFKRFCRDGQGCVLEPKDRKFYADGMTQKFEGLESEWPIFHAFMVIDGVFKNFDQQVEYHQSQLKRLIKYTDKVNIFFRIFRLKRMKYFDYGFGYL